MTTTAGFTPKSAWRNRIVGHGDEAPADLVPNPANWRLHPEPQQEALASVLDRVGWVQDVVVNRATGHIVDGHLRVSLALSRGESSVPVVYVELDETEEALILASIDPLAAMAGTDQAALEALLAVVAADGALGAMLDELAGQAAPNVGLTDPDAVPEPSDAPYVERGHVYALGAHRIMCGDATDEADVARVFAASRVGEVANDERIDWSPAWTLFPGDVFYCWHAGRHAAQVQASLESSGFEIRNQVIWSKSNFPISRGHYHWRHEPCWYAVRKGRQAHWVGDRKQTTIWEINLDKNVEGGHSTQKPVECMERPLRNHAGDVYDPFVGSGTTIIAAERTGRRCFAMEIEPKYAQVAIERWEQFTGQKAERVE